ncbi:MAG: hypothetical protein AAB676_05880 [Verrucomicrobiota bacterium]
MKLARLPHDPAALIDFFQESLEHLGAIGERTWHDRLQVVAEGAAAKLWNADGALLETELSFPAPGDTAPRQAGKEVFPGCPLTFHLAEMLRPSPVPLQRACLQPFETPKPPAPTVAEKLWLLQMPGTLRWQQESAFVAAWHFSLLLLVRCEIQAIDQHWSLHRLALSLQDGQREDSLAASLDFSQAASEPTAEIPWPACDLALWQTWFKAALAEELAADLAAIRHRQETYLRRELDRVDTYFEHYEQELAARQARASKENAKIKLEERLAAARSEHQRRRHDQVQRHEIRVIPHLDALLVAAEPAWKARVRVMQRSGSAVREARFVPRMRRWFVEGAL